MSEESNLQNNDILHNEGISPVLELARQTRLRGIGFLEGKFPDGNDLNEFRHGFILGTDIQNTREVQEMKKLLGERFGREAADFPKNSLENPHGLFVYDYTPPTETLRQVVQSSGFLRRSKSTEVTAPILYEGKSITEESTSIDLLIRGPKDNFSRDTQFNIRLVIPKAVANRLLEIVNSSPDELMAYFHALYPKITGKTPDTVILQPTNKLVLVDKRGNSTTKKELTYTTVIEY